MFLLKFLGYILAFLMIITVIFIYKKPIPVDVVDARYTSPSSQFLMMENGSRIHYRDEGNRQGKIIVLLHGSNASLHTWEPWVELLRGEFRIITLDLPGHGLTGSVPDNDYTTDAYIKVLDAVLRHLAVSEFVLGGNSMGGQVSWRYMLTHPNKVEALILVDAAGLPEWRLEIQNAATDSSSSIPIVFQLLTKPWFRAIAMRFDTYYLVKWGVEAAYNNSPVVTDDLIMRYYELALRKGTRAATMTRFAYSEQNFSQTYDLSLIARPTLIIWGEEDSFIPVSIASKFEQALPNTTLVTFSGVGHIPMEEIPEESANTVIEFMHSLSPETYTQTTDTIEEVEER
ncbi:MAG: alpha/beta hydrolase [Proteobacteria bacterium]|nr:alpha/beta hydrolase [Pseudomonadota bacterium]